jgi:hypothetical protein
VASFWQLIWQIRKQEVMKTINKVQKVAQKTIAVVVSIILISFTVSAQDFWKELVSTNQFEQIALAFADNTTSSKKVSFHENSTPFLEFYEEAVEEELELEEWMTNETYFPGNLIHFEEETESVLELENRMINNSHFNKQEINTKAIYSIEQEKGLELENWMIEEKVWNL